MHAGDVFKQVNQLLVVISAPRLPFVEKKKIELNWLKKKTLFIFTFVTKILKFILKYLTKISKCIYYL